MAPLVVIRAGAKEIEYRDPHTSWKQRVAQVVCERDEGDDSDASSSGNSDEGDEHDDERADDEADQVPMPSVYGMKTELLALSGMRVFRCATCANVVADRDDIIAKSFFGRTGKAFLMNAMFNVRTGPPRDRYLMTGRHTICDVQCTRCDEVLGWKYIRAIEPSQKYKEGKFIMERAVVEDDDDDRTRV